MKITELVEKIKTNKIQNTDYKPHAIEDFLMENIEFKTYLPFVDKRELCANVLEAACTKNGSLVEVDSVSRYLFFTINMITTYTNLEFENTEERDQIDDYDLLCENDLLNPILGCIGAEYASCNNLLNMMMNDMNINNNNITVVFNNMAQKLLNIVDNLETVIADKVEDLNFDLSSLDINKYKGLLEKLVK